MYSDELQLVWDEADDPGFVSADWQYSEVEYDDPNMSRAELLPSWVGEGAPAITSAAHEYPCRSSTW